MVTYLNMTLIKIYNGPITFEFINSVAEEPFAADLPPGSTLKRLTPSPQTHQQVYAVLYCKNAVVHFSVEIRCYIVNVKL